MIQIEIKPPANLDYILRVLGTIPGAIDKAGSQAVRRSIRGGKKDASVKVKERYTISTGEVTRTIKTRVSGLTGIMSSSGSRNPLKKFILKPRARINPQPARGLYANVVKGQGGDIPHSFSKYSGGAFERIGRSRFPIRSLKSVSAPQMLNSPPVSSYIVDKMSERMGKNLEQAMQAILGGFL